jgi:hypothetical protein
MTTSTKRFTVGFSVAAVIVVALNFLPLLLTRGAYHGDGFQEVGFPFVFHRVGGIAGVEEFRIMGLLSDITFALTVASFTGYCCRGVRQGAPDETVSDHAA